MNECPSRNVLDFTRTEEDVYVCVSVHPSALVNWQNTQCLHSHTRAPPRTHPHTHWGLYFHSSARLPGLCQLEQAPLLCLQGVLDTLVHTGRSIDMPHPSSLEWCTQVSISMLVRVKGSLICS